MGFFVDINIHFAVKHKYPLYIVVPVQKMGSVDEAREAGYDFSSIIVSVIGDIKGETVEFDNPGYFSGSSVAIIKENTLVSVPGTISYISDYATSIDTDGNVSITQPDGNNDATSYVYIIFTEDEK